MRRFRLASRLLQADLAGKIRYLLPRVQGKVPDPEKFIRDLAQHDPSGQKGDYLVPLVSYALRGGQVTPEIEQALKWHLEHKSLMPAQNRDLTKFDLALLPKTVLAWQNLYRAKSSPHPGVEVLFNKPPYQVVEIKNREAACYYFEQGGRWCTGNPETDEYFKAYASRAPLLVILKNQKPWMQYSAGEVAELKDSQNRKPGLGPAYQAFELLHEALPEDAEVLRHLGISKRKLAPYRDMEKVVSDPDLAYNYAVEVLGYRPFPAGEKAMASDWNYAFMYAKNILHGPFPAGEPIIAQDAHSSWQYAKFLKKPFPAGERAISQSTFAVHYAVDVLAPNGIKSFRAGEPQIARFPDDSLTYASLVLGKPFPAGEPAIADDSYISWKYATYILHDPDPNTWGQRYIAQHGGKIQSVPRYVKLISSYPRKSNDKYRKPVIIRVLDTQSGPTQWHWVRKGVVESWPNVDSRFTGPRSSYGKANAEADALLEKLNSTK